MYMKRWLKLKQGTKPPDTDWVYLDRPGHWKPVKKYRTVTKGKRKGQIEVTLFYPAGKKRIVPRKNLRTVADQIITYGVDCENT